MAHPDEGAGACPPPAEIFASGDLWQANENSGRIYMRRRSWPYLNGRALGAQTSRIERGGIVLTRLCRATSQRCAPPARLQYMYRGRAARASRRRGARARRRQRSVLIYRYCTYVLLSYSCTGR